jgi:hypothetical protein
MDTGTQADQEDVGRLLLLSLNGPDVEYDDKSGTEPQTYRSYLNPKLAKVSSKNSFFLFRNGSFKKCQMTKGADSIYIRQSI